MLAYAEAVTLLRAVGDALRLPAERVALGESLGRTLAADVYSPEASPRFRSASMDGYGVCAAWTQMASPSKPVVLKVEGSVAAGDWPAQGAGAMEVMTGAPLPSHLDAVVKREDARLDGGKLVFEAPVAPGVWVRNAGEDLHAGALLATAGSRVSAELILACAGVGVDALSVRARPKVTHCATGKELVDYTAAVLGPAQVRDASTPYLAAWCVQHGLPAGGHARVGDAPETFGAFLTAAVASDASLLLTTGGVSMGRHDYVPEVLRRAGGTVFFHTVAVRPGKPVLLATLPRKGRPALALLGLPGNPVSTAVGLRFFAQPLLEAMAGTHSQQVPLLPLATDAARPKGFTCFFRAALEARDGRTVVRVLEGQASHHLKALADMSCWVELPAGEGALPGGTPVRVHPL